MPEDAAAPGAVDALTSLRRTRRRKRLRDEDWIDVAYRAYLTGIVVTVAVILASKLIGDDPLTAQQRANLLRHGPAVGGLLMAAAIGLGARSGARGGPLSVESGEVLHVLLSPVPRARALARPAWQQLRRAAFVGATAGAIGGQLLGRRMEEPLVAWAAAGAAAVGCLTVAYAGVALVAHSARLPRWGASLLAAALVGWSTAALPDGSGVPAPFGVVGSLALWGDRVHLVDLVAPVAVAAVVALGVAGLGRFSLDALARRSALVSQLRFAVTMRDLRTVVLLRRQLSNEQHRSRPWVKVRSRRFTVAGRDAQSIARFPAARLVRMALLAGVAAVAQIAAFRGTTPAVVVSALAAFVLGLECLEPFAQELDQPDRAESVPRDRGWILARHLPVPAVVACGFALVAAVVAAGVMGTSTAWKLAPVLALSVATAGGAGAVLNILSGLPEPTLPGSTNDMLPPEVAGMREVFRTLRPLAVAAAGSLPVLAGRAASRRGEDPFPPAVQATIAVALLVAAVAWWTRRRDDVRARFRTMWAAGDVEFKARQAAKAASRGDHS